MSGLGIGVNRPLVASETIDGEAIIVHHGTGQYFEAAGSAAMIWQMIERGTTADRLVDMLVGRFAIERAVAQESVAGFLQALAGYDLLGGSETSSVATSDPVATAAFVAPKLRVHNDLADLLLLDPIHDVDASGWPAPRAMDWVG